MVESSQRFYGVTAVGIRGFGACRTNAISVHCTRYAALCSRSGVRNHSHMSLAALQNHAFKLKHKSCPHPSWRSLRIAARPRIRVLRKTACAAQRVSTDVVVIGAGAAGLTAAYFAAKEGAQVCIEQFLEQAVHVNCISYNFVDILSMSGILFLVFLFVPSLSVHICCSGDSA